MTKKPFSLPKLVCQRCGWGTPEVSKRPWYPRGETMPKCCPHCKSKAWDKPREYSRILDSDIPAAARKGDIVVAIVTKLKPTKEKP